MLDAQLLVLDLIRCLRPLVERLRKTCPDLASQVMRDAVVRANRMATKRANIGLDLEAADRERQCIQVRDLVFLLGDAVTGDAVARRVDSERLRSLELAVSEIAQDLALKDRRAKPRHPRC